MIFPSESIVRLKSSVIRSNVFFEFSSFWYMLEDCRLISVDVDLLSFLSSFLRSKSTLYTRVPCFSYLAGVNEFLPRNSVIDYFGIWFCFHQCSNFFPCQLVQSLFTRQKSIRTSWENKGDQERCGRTYRFTGKDFSAVKALFFTDCGATPLRIEALHSASPT